MESETKVKHEPGLEGEVDEACEELRIENLLDVRTLEIKNSLALSFLRKAEKCHATKERDYPDRSRWIQESVELREDKPQKRDVLIGIKGMTGAGKTTAINTLLGHPILPAAGSGRAVTSIPTQIKYNENLGSEFVAKLKFYSSKKLEADIKTLQKELEEEGDIKRDSAEEIKLRLIFPDITIEDLRQKSADKLLKSAIKKYPLDGSETIVRNDAADFRNAITPYVSSIPRERGDKTDSLWYIVEEITIFVKSDLLKDGLVLIDFPGAGDSNVARSSDHNIQLDAVMIFSGYCRGIDDKIADDLLTAYTELFEQLSGTQADNVIYVLTKFDEFPKDIRAYLEENPRTRERLKVQHPELQKVKEKVSAEIFRQNALIKVEKASEFNQRKKMNEASKKLREFCKDHSLEVPKLGRGKVNVDSVFLPDGLSDSVLTDHSKHVVALEDAAKLRQESEIQIMRLEKELKCLEEKQAKLMNITKAILIQDAMAAAIEDLKEEKRKMKKIDLGRTKNYKGRSATAKPQKTPSFHAIGISSQAYLDLKGAVKGDIVSGFRNFADSGIPGLRNMLLFIAGKVRMKQAGHFSTGFEIFRNEMDDWKDADSFNKPISAEEEEALLVGSKELDEMLLQDVEKVIQSRAAQIKTNVDTLDPSLQEVASSMSKPFAASFEKYQEMQFGIFKAIVTRGGTYMKKDKTYDWILPAMHMFQKKISDSECWDEFLGPCFKCVLHDTVDDIIRLLKKFGQDRSVKAAFYCPALRGRASDLQAELRQLRVKLDGLLEGENGLMAKIQKKCNVALTTAELRIKQLIGEACKKACDVEAGSGRGQRMRDAITNYIQNQGPKFFSKLVQEMIRIVRQGMSQLDTQLQKLFNPVIAKIPQNFKKTLKAARTSNAKEAKEEMKVILKHFQDTLEDRVSQLREDIQVNDPELRVASEDYSLMVSCDEDTAMEEDEEEYEEEEEEEEEDEDGDIEMTSENADD